MLYFCATLKPTAAARPVPSAIVIPPLLLDYHQITQVCHWCLMLDTNTVYCCVDCSYSSIQVATTCNRCATLSLLNQLLLGLLTVPSAVGTPGCPCCWDQLVSMYPIYLCKIIHLMLLLPQSHSHLFDLRIL